MKEYVLNLDDEKPCSISIIEGSVQWCIPLDINNCLFLRYILDVENGVIQDVLPAGVLASFQAQLSDNKKLSEQNNAALD